MGREATVSLAQAFIDGAAKAKASKAARFIADTGEEKEAQDTAQNAMDVDNAEDAQSEGASSSLVAKEKRLSAPLPKSSRHPKTRIRMMKRELILITAERD